MCVCPPDNLLIPHARWTQNSMQRVEERVKEASAKEAAARKWK